MTHDMTPDDAWVRRLQRRADEAAPDVPADAGAALHQGRRRRAARRTAAAGGVAALALAVAVGVSPAIRLVTDDARPAQPLPSPTPSVIVPTSEQLATHERDLARKADQNGIVDLPDVAVVRWITPHEEMFVMADCLIAAGWPITNVSAAGYEVAVPEDQESAMIRSDYICGAQYPVARP